MLRLAFETNILTIDARMIKYKASTEKMRHHKLHTNETFGLSNDLTFTRQRKRERERENVKFFQHLYCGNTDHQLIKQQIAQI